MPQLFLPTKRLTRAKPVNWYESNPRNLNMLSVFTIDSGFRRYSYTRTNHDPFTPDLAVRVWRSAILMRRGDERRVALPQGGLDRLQVQSVA